jgi:methylenetetrahydrofolate dehydrogenase (NADP+)/methenyltetrahydrofolate cyclohydrolase
MTARIIDGKAFAEKLRIKLKGDVAALRAKTGKVPGLAVVLVGEDPASQVYVANKGKATREAGMESFEFKMPASATEATLLKKVDELNKDAAVHGILVQLPLPKHINEQKVIEAIRPEKDVDGFHPVNVGRLSTGQRGMVSCTPLGCSMLIEDVLGKDLSGKQAVVIGRSNIVGKPMVQLLLQMNATVSVIHSRTKNPEAISRQADIIVAAVGKPRLVTKDWVKPGAVIIDVGINRVEVDGKNRLVGDVDFEAAKDVAGAITPVPGGVGPMTIACLLSNTVDAFRQQQGLK